MLIIDLAGNSGKHKLASARDILGGKRSDEIMARAAADEQHNTTYDVLDFLDETEEKVHEEHEVAKERESQLRKAVRSRDLRVIYSIKEIDPFDWLDIEPERERGYFRGKQLTEKMRGFLQAYNVNPDKVSYANAMQVIGELKARNIPSAKQARQLTRFGYDPNKMTKDEASKVMATLAANGWRR